jgi:hypothetical protein
MPRLVGGILDFIPDVVAGKIKEFWVIFAFRFLEVVLGLLVTGVVVLAGGYGPMDAS